MKRAHWLLLPVGLLATAAGILFHLPASFTLNAFALEAVEIHDARGTLRDGRIRQLRLPNGMVIDDVRWRAQPQALLHGALRMDTTFRYRELQGALIAQFEFDHLRLLDGRFLGPAAALDDRLRDIPWSLPGRIEATLDEAVFRNGRIVEMHAQAIWADAAIVEPFHLELGTARAVIEPDGGGGHRISLDNEPGMLELEGRMDVRANMQYRLIIDAAANADTPEAVRRALHLASGSDNGSFRYSDQGQVRNIPTLAD